MTTAEIEGWVLDYACKFNHHEVIAALHHRYGEHLSTICQVDVRLCAATLHRIVHCRELEEFNTAVELVEDLYSVISDKCPQRVYYKIVFPLKIMVLLDELKRCSRPGPSLNLKLNEFIPRCGIIHSQSQNKDMDRLQKYLSNFRKFYLSLLSNKSQRKAYIEEELETDFGEDFKKSLEKLTTRFLEEVEKCLPQTVIEKMLEKGTRAICENVPSISAPLDILLECLCNKSRLDTTDLLDLMTLIHPISTQDRLQHQLHLTFGSDESSNDSRFSDLIIMTPIGERSQSDGSSSKSSSFHGEFESSSKISPNERGEMNVSNNSSAQRKEGSTCKISPFERSKWNRTVESSSKIPPFKRTAGSSSKISQTQRTERSTGKRSPKSNAGSSSKISPTQRTERSTGKGSPKSNAGSSKTKGRSGKISPIQKTERSTGKSSPKSNAGSSKTKGSSGKISSSQRTEGSSGKRSPNEDRKIGSSGKISPSQKTEASSGKISPIDARRRGSKRKISYIQKTEGSSGKISPTQTSKMSSIEISPTKKTEGSSSKISQIHGDGLGISKSNRRTKEIENPEEMDTKQIKRLSSDLELSPSGESVSIISKRPPDKTGFWNRYRKTETIGFPKDDPLSQVYLVSSSSDSATTLGSQGQGHEEQNGCSESTNSSHCDSSNGLLQDMRDDQRMSVDDSLDHESSIDISNSLGLIPSSIMEEMQETELETPCSPGHVKYPSIQEHQKRNNIRLCVIKLYRDKALDMEVNNTHMELYR